MRLVAGAVVTAVAIAASAGQASAADVLPVTVPVVTPVVVPPTPVFDWAGFYLGAGTSVAFFYFAPDDRDREFHLTAYAGANFAIGARAIAGAEAYATVWDFLDDGIELRFGAEARVGLLATPRLLPYAALGIAHYSFGPGNTYLTLGGGVEIAIGRSLSLDLAYDFEKGLNVDAVGHRLTAAINFHFGN